MQAIRNYIAANCLPFYFLLTSSQTKEETMVSYIPLIVREEKKFPSGKLSLSKHLVLKRIPHTVPH